MDAVLAGAAAFTAADGDMVADGVDMALAWDMASVQAWVMVAPMRPLLAAAATRAAAPVVVFSAVFSNSVKLTVPWGGARRSKDAIHSVEAVQIDGASG
jgi:hypothetical protein